MSGDAAIAACHAALAKGSKSFAFAARLLPRDTADRIAVIYAWCRRADDAVDTCPPAEAAGEVARLRAELDWIYGRGEPADPVLAAFAAVTRGAAIPRAYPSALLDGMARDATGARYATVDQLAGYAYEVASTVGLMTSHVFGVREDGALRHAAHLGIAMQLTNICRDVAEDWERGRLYLPDDVCEQAGCGGLRARLGAPLAELPRPALARAVELLLRRADAFYASGDRGLPALPWRAGLAVRAARQIYARIGTRLARRGYDALAGRAIVPGAQKLLLALGAAVRHLAYLPAALAGARPRVPTLRLRFPDDVLPL